MTATGPQSDRVFSLEVEGPDVATAVPVKPVSTRGLVGVGSSMLLAGLAAGFCICSALERFNVKPIAFEHIKHSQVMEEAPAMMATRLQMANMSQEGDGWAPWQLVVQGDARMPSSSYTGPCSKWCFENAASLWRDFNGIWALTLNPDYVKKNKYEHQERIRLRFLANIENRMNEPTLMHFHGFTPPNNLDGIPFISSNPIQPEGQVFYDFMIRHRGFYWMHSHFGHQLESGLFAPIIVKDHDDFIEETENPTEVLMIIFDGHWRNECGYMRNLYPQECPTGGFDTYNEYQVTVNNRDLRKGGYQTVEVPEGQSVRLRILEAGGMAVYRVHLGGLEGEILATDGRRVERGVFKTALEMASAERFDVLLRIPNHGGRFNIIAERCTTHSDIAEGKAERAVLVLTTPGVPPESNPEPAAYAPHTVPPFGIEAFVALYKDLKSYEGLESPHHPANVEFEVRLTGDFDRTTGEWNPNFQVNGIRTYVWPHRVWCRDSCKDDLEDPDGTVVHMHFCQGKQISSNLRCTDFQCPEDTLGRNADGRCMPDGTTLDAWQNVHVSDCPNWHVRPSLFRKHTAALEVCQGDRVWITYISETPMEGHPMHLHGTHQQLIKINDDWVEGPMKDTWFVPMGQKITVAFDAVNPGEWLLHCHIANHVNEGMATTLRYTSSAKKCGQREWSKEGGYPEFADWRHTPVLPMNEWPDHWKQLWNKQPLP